ncbi:8794_t:CDS:2 [Dentiscutata erythropus]|uniref:8794_t:CDS:1 n=1 Tax=Dentiscutata erythropus TaxID=1348616 RepID=A0A9N8W191_9GLOM|nr:8794_t:CDS:2 [Dentiscutata erythropus]
MVKYTRECLLKNPMIVHISDCGLQATYRPIYKAYINQVFTHTTHGSAPRREVIAQELFLEKFSSNKAIKYKQLSENELQLLDSEIICQSKWKIEEVQDDQVFKLRSNPIAKYIYNQEVGDLLYLANNNNMNNENSFWIKFAEMVKNSSFSNRKVFKGLCNIMVQIEDQEQCNKGLQNLKYSDQFSDFIVILASLSPQAYNVFRQNLARHAIQNIRLHHACSPYALHDSELCFENIARVKRLVDTIEYASPIIAVSDNTKIKKRLGYSSIFSCIVGSVLSTESTKVSIYEDVYQIVDIIKSHNTIASQIPLPKFPPRIIAMIANQGKKMTINIFQLHKKLLDMAAQLQLKILGFSADGASAEFNVQNQLMQIDTPERLIFKDRLYNDDKVEIENKNEIESQPAELQNDNSLQIAEGVISIAAAEVNT